MHIKQITISGFKSYRDATVAGPFSPGHNVVVGRNGSGKSNFFDAVRFVLSDTFSSLRAEERVALLHEGAGASVLSAYVEMVFDNSDSRLPSDRDEVVLRRMIGLKKDEYILDRKNVTRSEVFNLFESAGFSRSNPYYIVQQGKVAALCAMTDKQRLELLQEVAGTRVYDERREESLKIMEDTDDRRDKISQVVTYIESRLAELESEKEELKAFQKLDKDRKALQYTMHVLELEEARAALTTLDGDSDKQRTRAEELNAKLIDLRAERATAEREANSLAPELKRVQEERDAHNAKRKEVIELIAKLQVDVQEASQAAEQAREMVASTSAELNEVRRLIREKKEALKPLEVDFRKLKDHEKATSSGIKKVERDLLSLRVKADRVNQFTSIEQRDTHIKRNIRDAEKRRAGYEAQITSAKKDIERLEKTVERNERKLENRKEELEQVGQSAEGFAGIEELRAHRVDVHGKRQDGWRKEKEIDSKISDLRVAIGKYEATKRSVLGGGTYHAVQAVMRFAAEDPVHLGPEHVYGPLVDLIDVDPKFSTAADVTAGSSLTHVVVDNDATAAHLVRIMQAKRAGRVTFIPLNRLESDDRPPPAATPDAIPLVSKISCHPMFIPAVRQVFGRTLVTRTVRIASDLSKEHGVDCVTLEGDQVNKRGAMTGGYMDLSRSRIDSARNLREAQMEMREMENQKRQMADELNKIGDELTGVLGELQRKEGLQRASATKENRLKEEISQLDRYLAADKENLPKANDRIKEAELSIAETDKGIEDLQDELQSPMLSGLSSSEEGRVRDLKNELEALKNEIGDIAPRRARMEKDVVSIRTELRNNLEKREAELKRTMASEAPSGDEPAGGADLDNRAEQTLQKQRDRLKVAEEELQSVKAKLKESDSVVKTKKKRHNQLTAQIEQDKEEEATLNKTLEEDQELIEKRYSHKAMETQKKSDAEKKIRELGSLPADFDKHRGLSMNALMKKLKKTNEALQKYSHVNKKALEQYLNFTEQREFLAKRQQELDHGAESIRSLIESLDLRKDEDILRTFKGVSKFFTQVFAELVPGGNASLLMLKSDGRGKSGETERESVRIKYTGVGMKVRFSSTGEAYMLRQLSGGQKSIVALALIFAIQRLDPAPFYLFDEIDANLDATHRQAVANLIRKQANYGTQFVTTTFRPEFVNAGDMWYGVTHKKKVSSVQEVSREVALTFITDEPTRR